MARILGFSWPQFKAAAHEIAYGSTEFPGKRRGSRVATMLFASAAVDRRDLASNYRITLTRLEERGADAQIKFRQICIGQKIFLRKLRKDPSLLPDTLRHYHFRKTLTNRSIANLVLALNTEFEADIFHHDGQGHFWVDKLEKPIEPKKEAPVLETAIINILSKKSRVLDFAAISQALKENGHNIDSAQLNATLDSLFDQRIIKTATDYSAQAFYLSDNETELVKARFLTAVTGLNELLTQAAVIGFQRDGQHIIKLHGPEKTELILSDYLEQRIGAYLCYYTEYGMHVIRLADIDIVKVAEKLLFGLVNGRKVAIQNCPWCRETYKDALEAYELSRLNQTLKNRQISNPEIQEKLHHGCRLTKEPAFQAIYRARKILEMGGSVELALASTYCNIPFILGNAPELIRQFQDISSWAVSIKAKSEDYIDNLIRMQRQVINNTDAIMLFLADRIAKAVYQNDTMTPNDWYEIRFLCAPIAEQNGFDRMAEQLKDLYLLVNRPNDHIRAAKLFKQKTGMDHWQAQHFLELYSKEIKKKICDEWVGLDEDEVEVFFRPKSLYSIAIKTRDLHDCLGVRIVIKCKGQNSEQRSFEIAQSLKPVLKEYLKVAQEDIKVDDNLAVPRASGLRHLKIVGRVENIPGQMHEIEMIVQTEQMYRFEKQADTNQNHGKYDIQKEDPTLAFEEYSPAIAGQITLSRDSNFRLLKEEDQKHNLFVFVACDSDGNPLISHANINEMNLDFPVKKMPLALINGQLTPPTPEDIYCQSRQTKHLPLSRLGKTEIYRFAKGPNGKRLLVKKKSGQLASGDVLVFHPAKSMSQSNRITRLKHALASATNHLTKFKAWQELEALYPTTGQSMLDRIRRGREKYKRLFDNSFRKKQIKKKFLNQDQGQEQILKNISNSLGFTEPKDFLISLSQGFIDDNLLGISLSFAIEHTGCPYSISVNASRSTSVEFSLPDRKGILRRLFDFGILTNDNVISLSTSSEFSFGQRRASIKFTLSKDSPFNEGILVSCLQSFYSQRPVDATYSTTATLSYVLHPLLDVFLLGLPCPSSGHWEQLSDLVGFVHDHEDMNIFEVDLPDISLGNRPGRVKIEIPNKEAPRIALLEFVEIYDFTFEEN